MPRHKSNLTKVKSGDTLLPPFKGYIRGMGCVYRINYKGGYFYIGSTVCISTRISEHKGVGSQQQRHPIKKAKMWKNVLSIDILKTSKKVNVLRRHEEKVINDYFKTVMCVNMARKYV